MKSKFLTLFFVVLLLSDLCIPPLQARVIQSRLNAMAPDFDGASESASTQSLTLLSKPKFLTRLRPKYSSFLQSKIEAESTTLTTALMWTKLLSSKKRKTKDGRKCANAFVQDGQTFTDCTATKSPDGLMTCR